MKTTLCEMKITLANTNNRRDPVVKTVHRETERKDNFLKT